MAKNRTEELQVGIAGMLLDTGGVVPVVNRGMNGSVATYALIANAAAGSGDAATEFVSSASGFKAFRVVLCSDNAIEANKAMMIGWSTTAAAQAAVTVILDALRTALATPDGAGYANTIVMGAGGPTESPWVYWDGETTIKTISVACEATDNIDVAVITVA